MYYSGLCVFRVFLFLLFSFCVQSEGKEKYVFIQGKEGAGI
jgi:hypothetical protein